MLRGLFIAAVLLFSGCAYDNHAAWWVGDVAPDYHDCRATPGNHAVLDLQEFRNILVLPFAWGGFRLFILTEPNQLVPGTTFKIPSPAASVILCDLSHGAPGDAITDVTGTVEVLKRRGDDVLVRMNLKGDEGYWSHNGKEWFQHRATPHEPARSLR